MLEKSKLEEISLELPEQERRELLARITRSLGAGAREDFFALELKQEEREKILANEMTALSGWDRFVLWLRRVLSGRSRRELFVDWKIAQLKQRIKSRASGLTGFETRDLSSKFARALYELYGAVFELRESFQDFHNDGEFRDQAILNLVERKYPGARKSVEDFVPREELEGIYAESGSEEELRKTASKRIEEYLQKIPDRFIHQLDQGMKPWFYLKNLVLFPFAGVFRHFKVDTANTLDAQAPDFRPAAAVLVLDQLERLYHAINLPRELGTEWFCHEEIFQWHQEYRRPETEAEEPAREQEARNAAGLAGAVVQLVEKARRFDGRVPLLDLIRYFRKDPYYRIVYAVPGFHVKPVYATVLKSRILTQLEGTVGDVKRSVVERQLAEVFKTDRLMELFYYVDRPDSEFRSLGLPVFGHVASLKVLYNYLSRLYKPTIQEAVQVANMYVLAGNRVAQARLNQYAAGLEELEARILLMDRSLSPDEEDGRTMMRLRHRLASDLNQQKLYRAFVAQKDKEARELIAQGQEHLFGIQRVFEELLVNPMESVKAVLRTLHFYKGRNITLSVLLRGAADLIDEFLGLLTQLLELEKGD